RTPLACCERGVVHTAGNAPQHSRYRSVSRYIRRWKHHIRRSRRRYYINWWAATGNRNYNISITNNFITNNLTQGRGIVVGGTLDATVIGNHVSNTVGAGILVMAESSYNVLSAERVIVSNNIVVNCPTTKTTYGAITVHGQSSQLVRDVTIAQNIIDTCLKSGILVHSYCKHIAIRGNRIANCGERAVYVVGTENVRIEHNHIVTCLSGGVRLSSTCTGRAIINDKDFIDINGSNTASADCIVIEAALTAPIIRANRHKSANPINRLVDVNLCTNAALSDNLSETPTNAPPVVGGSNPRVWP
ncbi:MAG: right-handed parallel beta-helix repeat-containing protein, partial [Halobacteriota archaeon]